MSEQRYLVTARKYRPQLFGEVVAQEHVTETLKNALRMDRLAHAYLFSGPRGVGKTTAARILAKAINCTAAPEDRADAAEPCRACDSCRSFEEGRNLNIIEIDAASNNKVEDIRDLRDTVRIPPQGNRKKVYIIDEVHMLSNAAFNALLKTLEEPPPYVLFIFATTEPNKVLPTILSRCQRFDFRRIAVPETVAALEAICQEEGITADEGSLMLLARKGDGALRDSLSVFDQAVSLCGTDLRHDALRQALGVVDEDYFFGVTQNVVTRDSAGMIRLVERIMRAGYDLQEFVDGLTEHLRNLLVARTMPDVSLIEAVEAVRQRYAAHARDFAEADLLRQLMVVADTEEALKTSRQPRLRLEMALLKMASLAQAADLRAALAALERLEKHAADGTLPAASAPPVARTAEPGPPAYTPPPSAPKPTAPPPAKPEPRPEAAAPKTAAPDATPPTVAEPEAPPFFSQEDASEDEGGLPIGDGGGPAPKPPAPAPERHTPAPQPEAPEAPAYPSLFGPPALKAKPRKPSNGHEAEAEAEVAVAAPPPAATSGAPLCRRAVAVWPRYVQSVTTARIHVGALLAHATPLDAEDTTLLLGIPDVFHKRLLGNQHDFLLDHLKPLLDAPLTALRFVIQDGLEPATAAEATEDFDPVAYLQKKRAEDPVVDALFEQFGGEIVW